MKRLINEVKKEYNITNWIYLALFALLAAKSIFINPFTKAEGVWGILLGVVIVALLFVASVVATHFVLKIGWKRHEKKARKTRILFYMIPGIVVSGILWLCYFPAIVPYDSAWIWGMISANQYNNLHPLIYTLAVKYLRMLWDSPAFIALLQLVYCSFVYGFVGYVFEKRGLKKAWIWVIVSVLALLPVNAIHSITMLKDIPYMISLVFISTLLLDYISSDSIKIKHLIVLVLAGLVGMFSRHNGMLVIPASLAFAAFLYLLNKNFKQVLCFGVAIIIVVGVFFGAEKLAVKSVKDRYYHKSSTDAAFTIPAAQMVYITTTHWGELSEYHKTEAEQFIDNGYVSYIKAKNDRWAYNFNFYACIKEENIVEDINRFIEFYFSLIKTYPSDAIKEYENMTAIVWAVPNYGYTAYRNGGISSYEGKAIAEENSLLPSLKEFVDNKIFRCSDEFLFLWRPALPMLLAFLLIVVAIKRHKKLSLLILSPAVFNMLGYMVVNPSQNVRYFYCNISIFIIFSVYTFMLPKKDENAEDYLQETDD